MTTQKIAFLPKSDFVPCHLFDNIKQSCIENMVVSASITANAATAALRRFCRNVPLPQLGQGSYLTIRSALPSQDLPLLSPSNNVRVFPNIRGVNDATSLIAGIPIHVIVEPSWRDTGHVEFQQFFPKEMSTNRDGEAVLSQKFDMVVSQDKTTPSLDRFAAVSHVTIDLIPRIQQLHQGKEGNLDGDNVETHTEATKSDVYYNKNIISLPKTSFPKMMDRVMYDDGNAQLMEDSETNIIHETQLRGTTRTDYQDGISHLTSKAYSTNLETVLSSYVVVTIQVPEKLNLACQLLHNDYTERGYRSRTGSNSIAVRGKLEGDVALQILNGGDIYVSKLRGHTIDLQTTDGGNIYASNLLEAQGLTMRTTGSGRIRAKQIHASNVSVVVDQRHHCSPPALTETDVVRNDEKSNTVTTVETRTHDDTIRIFDEDDDEGSLVDISSMFVSGRNGGAVVNVYGNDYKASKSLLRRAVRIKSHHGPVQVTASGLPMPIAINSTNQRLYPLVELGGVNGSCEVSIENTPLLSLARGRVQPDAGTTPDGEWSSCLVHVDSLAPESVSLVVADRGNITITLDRKTEADLRLASLTDVKHIPEVAALLAEENDDSEIVKGLPRLPASDKTGEKLRSIDERVLIQTTAFTMRPETTFCNSSVSFVNGWVENNSFEPDSRFERKVRGNEGGGKIRLEGAFDQALYSFSDSKTTMTSDDSKNSNDNCLRPLLAVVGTDQITVETVSWLGAIARRYGLDESGRELGRTASRKGRTLHDPNV
jgi:hypothetical protein